MRDLRHSTGLGLLIVLFLFLGLVHRARADGLFCALCGGTDSCQKTCRLVCEQKKVTITLWGCKEEDFCLPGPSTICWKHTDVICEQETSSKAPFAQPKKFAWNEWIPSGVAKVHTKKKLMKRTVTRTIPSFKWVVEDLCAQCEAECPTPNIPAGTKVPPAPRTDARFITPLPTPMAPATASHATTTR